TFSISAQSFWKISGVESAANAQHSGILYSPYRNAIYVSTYNLGILRTADKGTTWDHVWELPKDKPVTTLFAAKNGTILGGGIEEIYRNEANSDKWEAIPVGLAFVTGFAEDR